MESEVKSFPRQESIFLGNKAEILKRVADPKINIEEKELSKVRYFKNVGMGFRTPEQAIRGTYLDKKCPFTGNVPIRGRILRGIVKTTKMARTIVIRRDYLKWDGKYKRYERRHKNIPVHCSPCFHPECGDEVVIGECRPLSKTVRFNVLNVIRRKTASKAFKQE